MFIFSFCLFCFWYKKKIEKSEKYKNSVCFVYIGTCVLWMAIETKFSKLCIFCSLNEHLYAQLSKWALWFLFVMSTINIFFLLRDLFFTCFSSFFCLVIHNILFHYIHAFLWILCAPLIIFDHLYISRVKHSSFLYPLSIMTKRGRNCGEYVVSF